MVDLGVRGGMISATVLGIFFVPVFFWVIRLIFKGKRPIGSLKDSEEVHI